MSDSVCVCANLWDIICKFSCLTVGGAQYGPHEAKRWFKGKELKDLFSGRVKTCAELLIILKA